MVVSLEMEAFSRWLDGLQDGTVFDLTKVREKPLSLFLQHISGNPTAASYGSKMGWSGTPYHEADIPEWAVSFNMTLAVKRWDTISVEDTRDVIHSIGRQYASKGTTPTAKQPETGGVRRLAYPSR